MKILPLLGLILILSGCSTHPYLVDNPCVVQHTGSLLLTEKGRSAGYVFVEVHKGRSMITETAITPFGSVLFEMLLGNYTVHQWSEADLLLGNSPTHIDLVNIKSCRTSKITLL